MGPGTLVTLKMGWKTGRRKVSESFSWENMGGVKKGPSDDEALSVYYVGERLQVTVYDCEIMMLHVMMHSALVSRVALTSISGNFPPSRGCCGS